MARPQAERDELLRPFFAAVAEDAGRLPRFPSQVPQGALAQSRVGSLLKHAAVASKRDRPPRMAASDAP